MPGPVFEMPTSPAGWDGSSAQLVRIIDPLGDAIAWFAPELGGCCVGFAVRRAGVSADAQFSSWRHIVVGSTANPHFGTRENGESTTGSPWHFVERDPASCTIDWMPEETLSAERWNMTASLADTRLSLSLRFQNMGPTPIQSGIGLRLVLSSLPELFHLKGGQAIGDESATFRDKMNTSQGQSGRIVLVVESDLGTSTIQTEDMGSGINCTIADRRGERYLPIVEPGGSRRLSVLIGFWQPQPGHV